MPGLRAAYDDGWALSTYVTASVPRVWPALRDLRRGTVVFSVPPEPAPCAPTALKPLLMACGGRTPRSTAGWSPTGSRWCAARG